VGAKTDGEKKIDPQANNDKREKVKRKKVQIFTEVSPPTEEQDLGKGKESGGIT